MIPVAGDAIALAAARLTEPFEGFRGSPYQDMGGRWTIGYGSTFDAGGYPVTARTLPIGLREADMLMRRDLAAAADALGRLIGDGVTLTISQEAALIDFIYNVGEGAFAGSTLLRLLNAGDMAGAAAQFCRWDEAAGVVEPGLLRRRQAEADMFGHWPQGAVVTSTG